MAIGLRKAHKRKSVLLLTFAISFTFLIGCSALTGEEIARLPINQVSTNDTNLVVKETSLALKKNEKIAIWSEMNIEYQGAIGLIFRIRVLKDGEKFGVLEIDPTKKNITIGELRNSQNGITKWSFTGKNFEFTVEEDGNYIFEGVLLSSDNPTLIVNKAEIVLKK